MQPTMCSRCHKNVAVVFVQRIENGETVTDGLCIVGRLVSWSHHLCSYSPCLAVRNYNSRQAVGSLALVCGTAWAL
mgnify:CR=1 FL=1